MELMILSWTLKAILLTVIFFIPLRCVSGTNHSVGGSNGWDLSSNVQEWSATNNFHVGDTLVFTYTPAHNVLEVNELEYSTCRTINPISVHNSGKTVVSLTRTGSRYFVCGRSGHCAMGLKFRVDVLPQLPANETRHGGGGVHPRPPFRSPPAPPDRASPHPPDDKPEPEPEPGPTVPETPSSPGPCGNSAVGGMIMAHFLDSWWVLLFATLLVFVINSLLFSAHLRF